MVLSILIATITAPGLLGSQEAIRQSQSQEKKEEHRARRCNLIATCVKSSRLSREINDRPIVLRNSRLWIDTGTEDGTVLGHPYAGYYLPYPDSKYEGLVTTITDAAPIMNWVYIDRDTHQVRYGVRADAQPNLTGPFDCTRQDRRLTFDGWEGWCAVEEVPGLWALYFDIDDDGLKGKVGTGLKVLELELSRKEKRFQKESEARQQDQTTKRKVSVEGEAPVDEPVVVEAVTARPGVGEGEGEKGSGGGEEWKPLKIPKSIFEDPPPVVAPLVFRARTPPPAYSVADQKESVRAPGTVTKENGGSDLPRSTGVPVALNEPPEPIKLSPSASRAPPARATSTSPDTERRATPKRTSGTRALAQAQRFEALAAGKPLNIEEPGKEAVRSSPEIKAVTYTSSEYSNEEQELDGKSHSDQTSSPTPPPLSLAKVKEEPTTLQQANTTSRPRVPGAAKDPAIYSGTPETAIRPTQPRRPTITRQQSQSQSTTKPTQKNSPRPPQTKREPFTQRKRSSSEQPYPKTNSPTPSPRNAATTRTTSQPARTSLARTMTTGTGNRGMANRFAERRDEMRPPMRGRSNTVQSGGRAGVERKTTSALFREIDELVSQDVQGPAGGEG
ncbi:hypothetical protein T440DRAFT_368018, partial [Plenodomus tracheiphilus IPT5]